MIRQRLFIAMFCISFIATSAIPVFAWNQRVSAVTACSTESLGDVVEDGAFYPYTSVANCGMPNSSTMPHDEVQTLNIHGYSQVSGFARACLKFWNSMSISCGTWTDLGGAGVYGKAISTTVWQTTTNSFQQFPYVEVLSVTNGDAIFGFYLSN